MPCRKNNTYTESGLQNAIREVKGGMAVLTAAKKNKVPRGTLQCRLSGRNKKGTFGPPPILYAKEEEELVSWIIECHRKGFPQRKENIQNVVKEFLDKSPRSNPFKNNLPGSKWYLNFMKRHPQLSERTLETVTSASSKVSEIDIRNSFKKINLYLNETQNLDILENPQRIFNGDETNFVLCPKTGKVVAEKGARNVYEIDRGAAIENLTVMFTFSANGDITPPLIIYPFKRIPKKIAESVPKEWGIAVSDNGWMKSEIFIEYIKNIFHPYLLKIKVKLPIILYVDGHKSHLSYDLSKMCQELQILLICLPPNATRIIQPADVSVFRPLKVGWRKAIFRQENPYTDVTKAHVAPILKIAIESHVSKQTIINGFRACGLSPFNVDNIDFSKCLGKSRFIPEHITGDSTNNIQKTLNYTNFVEIVGNDKIKNFKNFENSNESYSSEFLYLYEIYKKLVPDNPDSEFEQFENNDDIIVEISQDENEINLSENIHDINIPEIGSTVNLTDFDFENIPIVILPNQSFEIENEISSKIDDSFSNILPHSSSYQPSESIEFKNFLKPFDTPEKKRLTTTFLKKPSPIVISSQEFSDNELEKLKIKELAEIQKADKLQIKQKKKRKCPNA